MKHVIYLSNSERNSLNSPPPSTPGSSAPAWFINWTRSFNFKFGSGINREIRTLTQYTWQKRDNRDKYTESK